MEFKALGVYSDEYGLIMSSRRILDKRKLETKAINKHYII